jgi:glycerol-3-phosphate dehydrogenase
VDFVRSGRIEQRRASVVVNAAGAWANAVLETAAPAARRIPVDLVQGAHLVLDVPAPRGIYYVEAPQDRRAVFVMPWRGVTLVGTTETYRPGLPATLADWAPLPAELEYLRSVHSRYFPTFASHAIQQSFAGLRVLPRDGNAVFSRRRETVLSWDAGLRILTLYGGKLTAYRATAEKVIDALRLYLPKRRRIADTARLRLEA